MQLGSGLKSVLSSGSWISYDEGDAPRWSDFSKPRPVAYVNVATEEDVQRTVEFCVRSGIPFIAQSGGFGNSTAINLPEDGVVINLRQLNSVSFNDARTEVTVGGGTINGELTAAAFANDALVMVGHADDVGVLGNALGGGFGSLTSKFGLAADQLLSLTVVLADGSLRRVTPTQNEDLWWAMRGAGPNFGIVTRAVLRSHPRPSADNFAYKCILTFDADGSSNDTNNSGSDGNGDDTLSRITDALGSLELTPDMSVSLFFVADAGRPQILLDLFFLGPEAEAKEAFHPLFALRPASERGSMELYSNWKAKSPLAARGGRKPGFGAGMARLDRDVWARVWAEYRALVRDPAFARSIVMCEAYCMDTVRSAGAAATRRRSSVAFTERSARPSFSLSAAPNLNPLSPLSPTSPSFFPTSAAAGSFPARHVRFHASAVPWYADEEGLDAKALAFGRKVRAAWRQGSGLPEPYTYVNAAFGDESNREVYGASTPRLRELKWRYDPDNVFGYWFSLGGEDKKKKKNETIAEE